MHTGDYPTQAQGLEALRTKPEGVDSSVWRGPYLGKEVPKDPWGNNYVYVFPGKNNKLHFDLYSLGEDGLSATEGNDPDDVNSWDPHSGSRYPDPMQARLRRVSVRLLTTIILLRLLLEWFVVRYRKRKRTLTQESSGSRDGDHAEPRVARLIIPGAAFTCVNMLGLIHKDDTWFLFAASGLIWAIGPATLYWALAKRRNWACPFGLTLYSCAALVILLERFRCMMSRGFRHETFASPPDPVESVLFSTLYALLAYHCIVAPFLHFFKASSRVERRPEGNTEIRQHPS
jgi:hypothetical protein